MVSKPRKTKRPRLAVVGHIGTPEAAVDLLSAALHRAEEDETLAVSLIASFGTMARWRSSKPVSTGLWNDTLGRRRLRRICHERRGLPVSDPG